MKSGVDSKAAGKGSGKGVPGCADKPSGVDRNSAAYGGKSGGKGKMGGRANRSRGY